MADPIKISVKAGGQPIQVKVNEERIQVNSPVGLTSGWPFGANPKSVGDIARDIPTVVDQVAMPGRYRVVKWLLLISDEANGLGVSSEINAFLHGGEIEFTEYAVIGDADAIRYEVDFVVNAGAVQMVFTSQNDGVVNVNTMKIGMFA
jgi:hypothetical protein